MDAISLSSLSELTGINLYLLVVIAIWSLAWKIAAMWKAAGKKSLAWFILLGVINTVGIFEILYIFVFSEMKLDEKSRKKSKKKKK